MNGGKVYVTSKGCYIVQTETNHIAAYLKDNGYTLVDAPGEADAIIVTTCAVTGMTAEANYQTITDCINSRTDGVPVYIVGCYTRIETQRMEEFTAHKNVFPVPEIRDVEREFLGTNAWDSIVYNNFFAHPFAAQKMEELEERVSLKHKLVQPIFSAIDAVTRKDTCIPPTYSGASGRSWPPKAVPTPALTAPSESAAANIARNRWIRC